MLRKPTLLNLRSLNVTILPDTSGFNALGKDRSQSKIYRKYIENTRLQGNDR